MTGVRQINVLLAHDQYDLDYWAKQNVLRQEHALTVFVGTLDIHKEARIEVDAVLSNAESVRFLIPAKRSRIGRGEVDALAMDKGKAIDPKQRPTDLYRCALCYRVSAESYMFKLLVSFHF